MILIKTSFNNELLTIYNNYLQQAKDHEFFSTKFSKLGVP